MIWQLKKGGNKMNDIFPKILISGDYNAFDEGFNACGVYACSGLYESKTFRIPWYIGSTIDLWDRIETQHIPQLQGNRHEHNKPLQDSWIKYGQENFVWWSLGTCSIGEEIKLEQYYFDLYRPFVDEFGGFNIAKEAGKPPNVKGIKRSDEFKKGISDRMQGNKFGLGKMCGEAKKQKISEKNSKEFTLLSPSGEIIRGKNIRKFCNNNELNECGISNVINGHILDCAGWRLPENKDIIKKAKGRDFLLVSPSGETISDNNVSYFCKRNNLLEDMINQVLNGQRISYRGWHLPDSIPIQDRSPTKSFRLLSPTNELIEGNNVAELSRKLNIGHNSLYRLINGETKSCKGWRRFQE